MTPEEVREAREYEELVLRWSECMTAEGQTKEAHDLRNLALLFAARPDGLVALEGLRQAAAADLSLPHVLADWFKERIDDYFDGRVETVDEALGLASEQGQHSPLTRFREKLRWAEPLALLHELACLGAPIEKAVGIVATKCGVGEFALERKYRDMNLVLNRKVLASGSEKASLDSVKAVLAQYRDDEETRYVKAAIEKRLKEGM